MPELDEHIKTYILRHFLQIIRNNDKLLEVSFENFYEIVNDDRLNVKAEEPVWEYCLRWIDYDSEHRKQHIVQLLLAIRLGLMGLEVSIDSVNQAGSTRT